MEPPRRRGEVRTFCTAKGIIRITPAWAGKSLHFFHFLGGGKDHPRVGGEKDGPDTSTVSVTGSPPHGRGKVDGPPAQVGRGRITPAQAGKSVAPRQKRSALWDHPRVGGEKYSRPSYSRISMGSPPRGRGKAGLSRRSARPARITPAWAGKSCCSSHCRCC